LTIDNTWFGVLAAAEPIINTVLPIVGGFLIDSYSSVWCTLAVNGRVLVGCLLTAIGALLNTFAIMIAGRVVYGLGSGQIHCDATISFD
jgi:MFS family permease